jgi:hypothetical protein
LSALRSFPPLWASVDGLPFATLVGELRGKLFDVMENQHYTYWSLLKKPGAARPQPKPLVSVSFNLDPSSSGCTWRPRGPVGFDSTPVRDRVFVNLAAGYGRHRTAVHVQS